MIQDIQPYVLHNEFEPQPPVSDDRVFICKDGGILLYPHGEEATVPTVQVLKEIYGDIEDKLQYVLTVDGVNCFIWKRSEEIELVDRFQFCTLKEYRGFKPDWLRFAGVTASHLSKWYNRNRFCGCCGTEMVHSEKERAMVCDNCGFIDYPKICPAVIVGVTDGDRIMLTKYANRAFTRYALIAGFCEIGESVERTIEREVLEEVGVKVKNIRYFGSQPWGISESLLFGFFADLDGDNNVTLDREELQEGTWFKREEIPDDEENELSLTYTMMQAFKRGELV